MQFLHNPSMTNVGVSFGAAFTGAVGLWAIAAYSIRLRKRDLTNPEYLLPEINSVKRSDADEIDDTDDEEEADIEIELPTAAVHQSKGSIVLRVCLASVCIAALLGGSWLTYSNYTILQSWNQGEDLLARKNFAAASTLYRNAIRIDPQIRKSHLLLAQALVGNNELDRAIPELQIASLNEKADSKAPMLLGDMLTALNRQQEAVNAYRQAIAIAPTKAANYVRLAICLARLGRNGDAVKELRYAVLLDPKSVMAKSTLGQALVAVGDKQEGLVFLKQAVQLAPNDVTTHNNLACGYAQDKQYPEAVTEFRVALALDPYFAMAYYNLGCALRDMGDSRGAIQAFDTYIAMCIKHPLYRAAALSAEIEIQKLKKQEQKLE